MADKDVKSTTEKPTAIVRPFSVNGVEIDYAKKKWIYPKHPRRTSRFLPYPDWPPFQSQFWTTGGREPWH